MLYLDRFGSGPDLVVVHGWGMHGGLLSDWGERLGRRFRVHLVDLPGHGCSPLDGRTTLEDWAGSVLEVAPARAWWAGWSLGGLVAMAALGLRPERFRGLVLVASTPKFVRASDWPEAVDRVVFEQFALQLENNADRTLSRFLSLQVRNSHDGGETLRQLRAALATRPRPDPAALRAGLGFLQNSDMRGLLKNPSVPVHWLLGERDTLVPAAVHEAFPHIGAFVVAGAGHAPFLSHPQPCTDYLTERLLHSEEVLCHGDG